MCGRFAFFSPREAIEKAFGVDASELPEPRYNIAPTQTVAAVIRGEETEAELVYLRWGLVPFWAKDPAIGNRMINARAETVAEKPAYRTAFKRRRCLILASGFYEWEKREPQKVPWFIRLASGEPFGMAGIWDTWDKGDDGPLHTCSIITAPANAFMEPIHHRMPVIFGRESMEHWLAPDSGIEALESLLLLPQSMELEARTVGRAVNSPANDSPELINPVEY